MKTILYLSTTLLLVILFLPVSTFSQGEKKAVYGILIDNTGTMRTQFGNVQILGKAIVYNVSQRGIISVFNFEANNKKDLAVVSSGTDWKLGGNAIEKYVDNVKVIDGQTTLFDSISAISKAVNSKADSEKLPEKIIVLVTDGEDRLSKIAEKKLIKELKESNVKVYAIGLIEELGFNERIEIGTTQQKAKIFLKKITKETGGNVIFPKLKKILKLKFY